MPNVHVVDMIMGSGKTSAALNHMNRCRYRDNFLYITPFLKEIDRVKAACPDLHFVEPQQVCGGSKLRDIKNFGITGPEDVEYSGANGKMNEFAAAMGICNLRHIDEEPAIKRM